MLAIPGWDGKIRPLSGDSSRRPERGLTFGLYLSFRAVTIHPIANDGVEFDDGAAPMQCATIRNRREVIAGAIGTFGLGTFASSGAAALDRGDIDLSKLATAWRTWLGGLLRQDEGARRALPEGRASIERLLLTKLNAAGPGDLELRVRQAIASDFSAGTTVTAAGWVLAETEVVCCIWSSHFVEDGWAGG